MKIFVSWLNYAFMSIFFGCLFIFQLTQTQSSFFIWNILGIDYNISCYFHLCFPLGLKLVELSFKD